MPHKLYALRPDGPKQIAISWRWNWHDLTVTYEGRPLGFSTSDQQALKAGIAYHLPDGSILKVRLLKDYLSSGLEVLYNNRPVVGSMSFPLLHWRNAYQAIFTIVGLNIIAFVLSLFLHSLLPSVEEKLLDLGIGAFYLGMGYLVKQRSKLALGLAFGLYVLDTLLLLVAWSSNGNFSNYGGLFTRLVLLYAMWLGFKALDNLQSEEFNYQPFSSSFGKEKEELFSPDRYYGAPDRAATGYSAARQNNFENTASSSSYKDKKESSFSEEAANVKYLQSFKQAVELAQSGSKRPAHTLLLQLLNQRPDDPDLLLWLVYTSPDLKEGRFLLERLSQLDPANPSLPAAWTWLYQQLQEPATASAVTTIPTRPFLSSRWLMSGIMVGLGLIAVLGVVVFLSATSGFGSPSAPVPPTAPAQVKSWQIPAYPGATYLASDLLLQQELQELLGPTPKINRVTLFTTPDKTNDIVDYYAQQFTKATGIPTGFNASNQYFQCLVLGYGDRRGLALILVGQNSEKLADAGRSQRLVEIYKGISPSAKLALIIS